MEPAPIQRYYVRNLDCAACAAKIENGLRRVDGVDEVVLNFATLTLNLRAQDTVQVQELVHSIEPGVDLIPMEASGPRPIQNSVYRLTWEIFLLAVSATLFVLYLLLEPPKTVDGVLGWESVLAGAAYLLAGWNVLAGGVRTLRRGALFDENVLMTIATVGALAIGAVSEAVGVMLFYKVGEMLQELAVSRSRRSIAALLAARPERAMVQSPLGLRAVPPEQVAVGDSIVVQPGEKMPLDGTVLSGSSQVDNSPLTGESLPQNARPGDMVMAGSINLNAALMVQVTRPFKDSSIARILDLVQNAAARKTNTEKFITTFARYYTPAVVATAALIAFIPPLLVAGATFQTWIYRALVLLVISCPCALVISIPLGYFGGIGHASRRGILIKGSNFLDALAKVKTVVFDKTGTLTQGVFEVEKVVGANGYNQNQVLAYAAAAELHATHPIGASIVRAFADQGGQVEHGSVVDHQVIPGLGVRAVWNGQTIVVGSDALLHREMTTHEQCVMDGTVAHVTVDGQYLGYILIGDQLKPQAAQTMTDLRANGVERIIMLTGDNRCAAEQVAQALDLDQFHADLLPENKVSHFERILMEANHNGTVAYVGDGINDAPVLARADVGVAMGALGSAAAIETADVVLMTDSPAKMVEAIVISRHTRRIVWQNIFLALGVKAVFIVFGTLGLASMWEAVFADMGTALLAVLNATRALGKKEIS